MVCRTGTKVFGRDPKGLTVRENRRGTLKRMPGGVGGTAATTAYPSRLARVILGAPTDLGEVVLNGQLNERSLSEAEMNAVIGL